MAYINIGFNGKEYLIEQSAIKTMIDNLKNYITTNMAGTGTSIQLDGQTYQISSTKYSGIVNNFVSYLGTITGDGSGKKITFNGITYTVNSSVIDNASTKICETLEDLSAGTESLVAVLGQAILGQSILK